MPVVSEYNIVTAAEESYSMISLPAYIPRRAAALFPRFTANKTIVKVGARLFYGYTLLNGTGG